jgi:hypothetical protein
MKEELEELTRMIAGGIAVAAVPGCSSLGWPFCWIVAGLVTRSVVDAGFNSIGCACASARAIISSLSRATQETL